MKMLWNDELDGALRDLHAKGLSFGAISDKMGVSRNAIAGRCHRLHLSRNGAQPPMRKSKTSSKQLPPELKIAPVSPTGDARGAVDAILSTRWRSCRFSIGDPRKPDFQFCGQVTRLGQSYCPDHYKIVYYKDSRR